MMNAKMMWYDSECVNTQAIRDSIQYVSLYHFLVNQAVIGTRINYEKRESIEN